ncbi:MAG: NDP-sugar synthase, partial [Planctomycetia bacterium]
MTSYASDSATLVLGSSKYDVTGQQVTRAAIFCTDEYKAFGNIAYQQPIWLIPIAGRPMLDRVLGQLADFGIQQVDIFVSQHAMETYKYVAGEITHESSEGKHAAGRYSPRELGRRWGLEIKIVDVTNTHEGLRRLIHRELDEPILVGSSTSMPPLSESFPCKTTSSDENHGIRVSRPVLFRDTQPESEAMWMILRPERFVSQHCRSLTKLGTIMASDEQVELVDQPWPITADSVRAILRTQRLLLEEAFPGQPIEANRVEEGLWIGRNVRIHPSVQLIPPVYIGADCRIERGVVLGPNASIANHCIVEERTSASNSFVLPDTFVGRELTLEESIAGPRFMQTIDSPQPFEGIDRTILGPYGRVIPRFLTSRLFARLVGVAVLAILGLPILLLWCLGRLCGIRQPIRTRRAVLLPAYGPSNLWYTFPYREFCYLTHGGPGARFFGTILRVLRARRWPALLGVVSGKVAWVGLRPRGVYALNDLPPDRRALCMQSKVGLVRLAELDEARHGKSAGDQEYASDIYYVATASPWFDIRLLWRALWTPFR